MIWKKILSFLGSALVLALGLLAGFFVDFNSVFSDSNGLEDDMTIFAVVLGVYFLLAFAATVAAPLRAKRWAWFLATPGLAILALYTLTEPNIPFHGFVAALTATAIWLGIRAGVALRLPKKSATV